MTQHKSFPTCVCLYLCSLKLASIIFPSLGAGGGGIWFRDVACRGKELRPQTHWVLSCWFKEYESDSRHRVSFLHCDPFTFFNASLFYDQSLKPLKIDKEFELTTNTCFNYCTDTQNNWGGSLFSNENISWYCYYFLFTWVTASEIEMIMRNNFRM